MSDGSDVPVAGQVFRLAVDAQPGEQLVTCAEVQLGVTEVQIAVGQKQRVTARDVHVLQIGGVVAAAGKGTGKNDGK